MHGVVHKHNVSFCGTERREDFNLVVMNCHGVITWCAVSEGRIKRPYNFEIGNDTGVSDRNMLIRYAFVRFRRL